METTNILGQPPSVWYIDNRLSQRHQMFNNAPVHYEPRSDQYVMNSQLAERAGLSAMTQPPPRPMETDIRAMRVWNSMYLDAIEGFRSANEAPKRRSEEYSIHKAGDWDEVYAILERARGKYQDEGGKVGWFRNVRRKVADNVAPVQVVTSIVSKTVPDNPYSTPVLGAVGILLDAVKQSAVVRNQVAETFGGEGFENLIPIFSDVELFLGDMFDKDPNIRKASLDLAMAALKAIDLAVGFYTRKAVRQSSKALFMGSDYEKPLLDSLKDLNAKSRKLVEEAYKSHIHEAHRYSEYGRRMMRVLHETMGDLQETVVDGFNGMNRLLGEHIKLKDEQIQQKDAQLEQKNRELLYLKVENERLRSVSPAPSPWSPPVLPAPSFAQVPIPVPQPLISQEQLEMALEMSATDLYDMNFIFSTESEFPSLERAQTEQIIQQRLFANWVVCTDSSRLLVQWEAPLPHTYADLTPLSLFCAKMVQALAGKDRFLSIQWFYGCHLRYHTPEGSGHTMLLGLVAQLLRAYRGGFDMRALAHSIDLHTLLSSPDMKILERLLTWLVRALPRTVTLFCFVDGVVLCERSEHWDTAAPALLCLLRLVRDPAVQATVKVLFTSAPGPITVRSDFEDEGLIVNVETLPRLATAPSDERMMRELGEELSFRTS